MSATTESSGSHSAHAKLSPSGSKTWTTCTAAPAFAEANAHRIPADTSSAYSREGTEAHDWAADVLLKKITLADVPEEIFREPVGEYVNHCLALVPDGVSYQVEVEAPLWYSPGSHGTSDFAVITDDLVIIRDLKFGQGVLVHGESNSQLAIYAYSLICMMEGIYDFHDDTIVNMGVFQPRHREAHDAQPWVVSLKDLKSFCDKIEYKAMQCNVGLDRVREKLPCGQRDISAVELLEAAPGLRFEPQDGDEGSCRWCKNKAFCEVRLAAATEGMDAGGMSGADLIALLPDLSKEDKKKPAEERVEVVAVEVEVLTEGEIGRAAMLTDEYLVNIYRNSKHIRRFLDDVEEHLEARALAGSTVPGTKLVSGREGNRAWVSEEEADTFLKGKKLKESERYNFKLKSPTEMEKVLDIPKQPKRTQTRWNELVVRSPGKPVLALADDKREAITASINLLPDLREDDEV